MLVVGPSNRPLASRLAQRLEQDVVQAETKAFPDGEAYVRVSEPIGEPAIVVAGLWPPDRFTQTLLLLDAVRQAGAPHVTALVPYLAYARQDRVFRTGEALSSRVVCAAIGALSDRVVTVDPHEESVLEAFGRPAAAASAVEPLAAALAERDVEIVLAPDEGYIDRARALAAAAGAEVDHFEKTRVDSRTIRLTPKSLDVKGRRVAVVDDIISTGGTMVAALGMLSQQGAEEPIVAAVHGLLLGDCAKRLKEAGGREILCTDTIDGAHATITVADEIASVVAARATNAT